MTVTRLDEKLKELGLVYSRSQANNYIKLGLVSVEGNIVYKSGLLVNDDQTISIEKNQIYVSRAALKLKAAAEYFAIDFIKKTVLDVGSSTGGFTEISLEKGADLVVAVDIGTNQFSPRLRMNPKISLYEKTDIRNFKTDQHFDLILIDVSFISFRNIATSIYQLASEDSLICFMAKPQFETVANNLNQKGVIKNNNIRRQILKDLEIFISQKYKIINKVDSKIAGQNGNVERFYLIKKLINNF